MNFEQLKIIIALSQEKNFSRTANRLKLTTSAVSQGLSNLEKELDVKIFNRGKAGSFPTEKGQYIIREAYRILEIQDEIYRYSSHKGVRKLKVTVGCIPGINYLLISTIKSLKKAYEFLEVSIIEADTESLLRLLREKKLNYAILSFSETISRHGLDYKITKLTDGEFLFIVNKESLLGEKEILSYEDILNEPLVIYEDKFLFNYISHMESVCNKKSNTILRSNNFNSIINTVEANMAISLAPSYAINNNFKEVNNNIKVVPVEENESIIDNALWFLDYNGDSEDNLSKDFFRLLKNNII